MISRVPENSRKHTGLSLTRANRWFRADELSRKQETDDGSTGGGEKIVVTCLAPSTNSILLINQFPCVAHHASKIIKCVVRLRERKSAQGVLISGHG